MHNVRHLVSSYTRRHTRDILVLVNVTADTNVLSRCNQFYTERRTLCNVNCGSCLLFTLATEVRVLAAAGSSNVTGVVSTSTTDGVAPGSMVAGLNAKLDCN